MKFLDSREILKNIDFLPLSLLDEYPFLKEKAWESAMNLLSL